MSITKEELAHAKKQDQLNSQSPDFQEYPKVVYNKDGQARTVNSAEQEKSAKGFTLSAPPVTGEDPDAYVEPAEEQEDDIEALREQAKSLDIEFDNRIGATKLKALIDAKRAEQEQ
jgi:hypothetical protein